MAKLAKYKVGMVGCGRQGTQHARGFTLNPSTEVVAIADPDPENLELACKRFNARGYRSSDEMYFHEKLDIVDCVLPVSYNPAEVIKAAEKSGAKGIVSEKPIAALLSDADRMVEACASRGIPWQGGNVDRSISQLWEAKRLIDGGRIGQVRTINLYEKTMQGGVQGISLMQMFAGDADADWVTGWTNGDPFGESDDEYEGIGGYIRFKNGIECFVHASTIAMRGISVLGTDGMYVTDKRNHAFYKKANTEGRSNILADLVRDESIKFAPMRAHAEGGRDADGWEYPGDRLMGAVQSIVDCLDKGIEPRCPGYVHRKSLEITIAMRESARRNHSPVKLPLVSRNYRMLPQKSRWVNKKELYGKEWYAEQISRAKQG